VPRLNIGIQFLQVLSQNGREIHLCPGHQQKAAFPQWSVPLYVQEIREHPSGLCGAYFFFTLGGEFDDINDLKKYICKI
jgi:hypothetical protein